MLEHLPYRRALFGGVAIMGGAPDRYPAFLAHIEGLTVNQRTLLTSNTPGAFRTTLGGAEGNMNGAVWGEPSIGGGASVGRIARHAAASQVVHEAGVAAGDQVYLVLANISTAYEFYSRDRNGYVSQFYNDGEYYPACYCTEFIAFNRLTGRAYRSLPNLSVGPADYDF